MLDIVNKVAINLTEQVLVMKKVDSVEWCQWNGHMVDIFWILVDVQHFPYYQRGCDYLWSHQPVDEASPFLISSPACFHFFCWSVILTCMKWNLKNFLICISPTVNSSERCLRYFLVFLISFFQKYLFNVLMF